MGIALKLNEILELEGVLKGIDYETLTSGTVRWRKTAQFARNTMVKDGRLKSKSPRGIWEISEVGRMSLTKGAS